MGRPAGSQPAGFAAGFVAACGVAVRMHAAWEPGAGEGPGCVTDFAEARFPLERGVSTLTQKADPAAGGSPAWGRAGGEGGGVFQPLVPPQGLLPHCGGSAV